MRRAAMRLASVGCGIVTILLATCSAPAFSSSTRPHDGTWSSISAGPSARLSFAAAWDSQRARMLLFGGNPVFLNDVWAFSTAADVWSQIQASGPAPSPRYGTRGVYDPIADRFIVFGGYDGNYLNDAWSLSLSGVPKWSRIVAQGAPPPRGFHTCIYDAANRRLIVFGGYDGVGFRNDVWALSLSGAPGWTEITPSGPSPAPRDLMEAIYDPPQARLVVFGGWNGAQLADTWTLSLGPTPVWTPLVTGPGPNPRREYSAIYDAARDRMVLFGGFAGYDLSDPGQYAADTWALELRGTPSWQLVDPGTSGITGRYGH